MKLWTLQPYDAVETLTAGEAYQCIPELATFYDDSAFVASYDWLSAHMSKSISNPNNIRWPIWAWARNYGEAVKPDRRRSMFNNYDSEDVILELAVPDELVLLSDFDDWHYVLNGCEFISDADFYADEERVYTQEEKEATWLKIFNVDSKPFVQACIWEIRPEYLIKVHRLRKRS